MNDKPNNMNRKLAGGAVAAGLFISALIFFRPDGAKDEDLAEPATDNASRVVDEAADEGEPAEIADAGTAEPELADEPAPADAVVAEEAVAEEVVTEEAVAEETVELDVSLGQLCMTVNHQSVEGQNAVSGIWVRGEINGLDDGWIWVEGPTINNGEPVQVPVAGGGFNAPLGINTFGEHELTRFEIGADGAAPESALQSIIDVGRNIVPVSPDQGAAFDTECIDFE